MMVFFNRDFILGVFVRCLSFKNIYLVTAEIGDKIEVQRE